MNLYKINLFEDTVILLTHPKKFGNTKLKRLMKQAHEIMTTQEPYMSQLMEQGKVHKQTYEFRELEKQIGWNENNYPYFVQESSCIDILIGIMCEDLGFTRVELCGTYNVYYGRKSCIEVPQELYIAEEEVEEDG